MFDSCIGVAYGARAGTRTGVAAGTVPLSALPGCG